MTKVIIEIIAFLVSTSGWVLMSSTLPADYWKVSSNDASIGAVITTASFWRNLWKVCLIDSTGVTNCRDFPSLLELDGYIQVCRALMITAVCLGFFAIACALVGMKCTKIGGNDQVKARIVCASGIQYFICGICSLTAFSLYANRTMNDFFDPMFMDIKYEIGSALFIGWAGAIMCILGGIVFSLSLFDIFRKRSKDSDRTGYAYSTSTYGSRPEKAQKHSSSGRRPPIQNSSTSKNFHKDSYV